MTALYGRFTPHLIVLFLAN